LKRYRQVKETLEAISELNQFCCGCTGTSRGAQAMIAARRLQRSFADGLIMEEVQDLWTFVFGRSLPVSMNTVTETRYHMRYHISGVLRAESGLAFRPIPGICAFVVRFWEIKEQSAELFVYSFSTPG
jgi:hypothetical protein